MRYTPAECFLEWTEGRTTAAQYVDKHGSGDPNVKASRCLPFINVSFVTAIHEGAVSL